MPSARDARQWAADGGLHGLGESVYTPFSGPEGDGIDEDAYRQLIRYLVGDLRREMLWTTSGIGEWWSLTMDERKRLLEATVEEARAIAPGTVIQACTGAASAKDSLELTQHAEAVGADICYLQTPPMEVHAGEGVLRFFEYIAERTDIALGMFNSPSSGYVLTAREMAEIYRRVPAVVALKEGVMDSTAITAELHALAPGLQIWECDTMVYEAGWLRRGIVTQAQLGSAGYLFETRDNPRYRTYWELVWAGRLEEAADYNVQSGLSRLIGVLGRWFCVYPGRPAYFTHWGAAYRYSASVIGLPVGDYPESRPPQAILPEEAKAQIRAAYEAAGMIGAVRLHETQVGAPG
jgi:4-hydroxy-tetrahydrodipicolinate synthase